MDYPFLAKKEIDGKPFVAFFFEENKGIVVVNETDDDSIKFGKIYEFDENEFEFLPSDQAVRLSN